MIKLEQVCKSFNGQIVLDHLDLEIEPQKTTVIIGQSGGGKSVLLKHIIALVKPDSGHIREVKYLDHVATRVEANNRDRAIIEFMELTNYNFDFAIYIRKLNSITSVTRLTKSDFALVFTSGIARDIKQEYVGPTEMYVRNYGPRVHHMAFYTEDIDYAFDNFKKGGMQFLSELVGSPEEGLKQAFTVGSTNTLLVNEYIHRFGDFDGFFTRSNVEILTRATEKQ